MKQTPKVNNGFLLLLMRNLLQKIAAKFESPEKRAFKKLKRFITG
jgi:hypothetical protein